MAIGRLGLNQYHVNKASPLLRNRHTPLDASCVPIASPPVNSLESTNDSQVPLCGVTQDVQSLLVSIAVVCRERFFVG